MTRPPNYRARSTEVEEWLDQHHVEWSFDPEVPVERIDVKRSLQNQARVGEPLIGEVVDRYAAAMTNGSTFPALVAYRPSKRARLVLIGGNHRLAAATKAGHESVPVYVCGPVEPEAVAALTYEDNARHGMPPSTAERVRQAVHLIGLGWTAKAAAAAVSVSEAQVSQARKATEGSQRARDLGVTGFDLIASQATQVELARIPSDPVFAEAVRAVAALGLSVADTQALAKALKRQRSEAAQLKTIGDLLEERRAEAQRRAGGNAGQRTRTARSAHGTVRSAVVDILDVSPAQVADLLRDPTERKHLRARIAAAMVRLNEIREALS